MVLPGVATGWTEILVQSELLLAKGTTPNSPTDCSNDVELDPCPGTRH
jgi:hypothetical protein